jgi:hypothetical protein
MMAPALEMFEGMIRLHIGESWAVVLREVGEIAFYARLFEHWRGVVIFCEHIQDQSEFIPASGGHYFQALDECRVVFGNSGILCRVPCDERRNVRSMELPTIL